MKHTNGILNLESIETIYKLTNKKFCILFFLLIYYIKKCL